MQKNKKTRKQKHELKNPKYVIYCRKSRDENASNQTQSLLDQLKYCLQYVNTTHYAIELRKKDELMNEFIDGTHKRRIKSLTNSHEQKILKQAEPYFFITEQVSAAEPNIRPKWNKLMKYVEDGKINGILSYSPDRHARNLKESGELIQFIDEGLVDVKYTNFNFENNPSGRMVLGMNFVISYNYSDALSQAVKRGKRGALERGKADGKFKHGYFINEDGYHEKHPKYFNMWKEAFRMKIYDRATDEEIGNYLDSLGYKREYKNKKTKLNHKSLYKVRLDEFYYGILIVGDQHVDLNDLNPYFKPLIKPEEHQILLDRHLKKNPVSLRKRKPKDEYDCIQPFTNDFIIHEETGKPLYFSLPNKKRYTSKLEMLKVENPEATLEDVVNPSQIHYKNSDIIVDKKQLSLKTDILISYVYNYLKQFWSFNDVIYQKYVKHKKKDFHLQTKKNDEKRLKLQLQFNQLNSSYTQFVDDNLGRDRTDKEQEVYDNKARDYEERLDDLENQISESKNDHRNYIREFQAYMEAMRELPKAYKEKSYVRKRKFITKLFSNIIVDNKKRLKLVPKPLLEKLFISSNQGGETGTHDL